MAVVVNISDLKNLFPDEWVLLGNPINDVNGIDVISGIPLYHSKDKKEVCYIGRDKTEGYKKATIIYTGDFKPTRTLTGIFTRLKK